MDGYKEKNGSFFDHLEELRQRIIYIILWFCVASLMSYVFNSQILAIAIQPLLKFQKSPVFVSPIEPFLSIFKLVLFSGLLLTFPFLIHQVYVFVKPALANDKQTRLLGISLLAGIILFYSGTCFGYFFIMPYGLKLFFNFGKNLILPMVTIGNYLNFLLWLCLILGIVFQLPVIIFFLGYTGIVDVSCFRRMRKFIYVSILIVAAVITPTTDAISLAIMSGILIFLYEISLVFLSLFLKRKLLVD